MSTHGMGLIGPGKWCQNSEILSKLALRRLRRLRRRGGELKGVPVWTRGPLLAVRPAVVRQGVKARRLGRGGAQAPAWETRWA